MRKAETACTSRDYETASCYLVSLCLLSKQMSSNLALAEESADVYEFGEGIIII